MKGQQIRHSFVEHFASRDHQRHPSVPLVPHGDPTLLFTNAGMVPFKDYFLGAAEPARRRAVSVQKCMRVSGKHNDLDNVGPSPRHHTFFEMLGNFSFGDYFKEEAILYAWELVTGPWGLDPGHLWATVFEDDDEAERLWREVAGLPAERVLRCGADDNFWAMGDVGPCGPCSEIFVDRRPEAPQEDWQSGTESGRYLEIWNLVFMQFERLEGGETRPLPDPSIDTGAGLERVAAVLQGVDSNYDTDLFRPLLEAAATLASTGYGADDERDVDLRVIADHLRAVTFLLADGVIPGNEGRGYVLRRILRRAVRHGMRLGFEEPFLHRLIPVVGEVMGAQYPELGAVESASAATVEAEEGKFLETVAGGAAQVQAAIEAARRDGRAELAGEEAFRFYDTYGLPLELLREIAEEEQIGLDEAGFERALESQRSRSREALGLAAERLATARETLRKAKRLAATEFVGYDRLKLPGARLAALVAADGDGARTVGRLEAGEEGIALLDRSPFYGEAGGQVGDRGRLRGPDGEARVVDTQRDEGGAVFHFLEVTAGRLAAGDAVTAEVDAPLRRATQRNHTATHLLHAALRHVLGHGVRQAGSLVAPDRLRFDFTHPRPLEPAELSRIEELVNRWILAGRATRIEAGRDYREAVAAGAMHLFGEKYGDRVRTVEVPGPAADDGDGGPERSLELCGGCHVENTGQIGPFVVLAERGVASGVRRIEALTGDGARRWIEERRRLLERAAGELAVDEDRVPEEAARLQRRLRELERQVAALRREMVAGADLERERSEVDGVQVLAREVPSAPAPEIRGLADLLRDRLGSGVVVLGSREEGRVSLVTTVSKDLTDRLDAGRLARRIAELVDGKGGGRRDFAQAGGRQPERLPQALAAVPELVRGELGGGEEASQSAPPVD